MYARRPLTTTQHLMAAARPLRPVASPPLPGRSVPAAAAVAGLGRLALLPNETIMLVLAQCTLCTLLALLRVNRAAAELVRLLPRFAFVRETALVTVLRATRLYRRVMARILRIVTYEALRALLTGSECEACGRAGAGFRMARVRVLCDGCYHGRKG
ncbi:hypothetical protein F5X96DRAFT_407856 [Biscogniauxia mediterranea]|nr:hypothetical protein F5X96DRAFT_407856 [Biscogniauxia mediterranea]